MPQTPNQPRTTQVTLREDWKLARQANRELMMECADQGQNALLLTHIFFGWLIIPLAVAAVRFQDWRTKRNLTSSKLSQHAEATSAGPPAPNKSSNPLNSRATEGGK